MCVKGFELENAVIKSIEQGGGGIQFECQVEKDKRQRKKPRESDRSNRSVFQEKWKQQRRNI